MIFTDLMVITTILDKLFGKELKSSDISQNKRTFLSAFLYDLTTVVKMSFLARRLKTQQL